METVNENKGKNFDFTQDTLERYSLILRQINELNNPERNLSPVEKQYAKLSFVKQAFVQVMPLLSKDFVKENKDSLLKQEMTTFKKPRIKNKSVIGHYFEIDFSRVLEDILDNHLVEIQSNLFEQGFFDSKVNKEKNWEK
jgi:hypothetical protein